MKLPPDSTDLRSCLVIPLLSHPHRSLLLPAGSCSSPQRLQYVTKFKVMAYPGFSQTKNLSWVWLDLQVFYLEK